MDHQEIEARDWVGRYLRHELTEDETALFEEHLMTCGQCLDEVEADERFGRTLSVLAEEGRLSAAPSGAAHSGARRRILLAWAASLLVALLPAWFLYRQGEELERRLVAQQQTAAGDRAQSGELIRELQWELDEARRQSPEPVAVSEPTPPAPSSDGTVERLERELREATRPRSGVPVVHLAPTRSTGSEDAAHRLTLDGEASWVVLILEPAGFAEAYELELTGPDGSVLLREQGLEVDGYGALTISVYSPDLKAGAHRLRLAPDDGGPAQTMGLQVVKTP